MIHVPVLRWGKPYQSLETEVVEHFATGEPVAEVSRANAGIVSRDLRKASRARAARTLAHRLALRLPRILKHRRTSSREASTRPSRSAKKTSPRLCFWRRATRFWTTTRRTWKPS